MARREAIAGGALLVFAAFAVHEAGKLPYGSVNNPGPGFLPWWTGAALGLLAVLVLGRALAAGWGSSAGRGGGGLKVGGLVVALVAYVLLLESVGYPLCTFLIVLFMLRVVDRQPGVLALGVGALAALGSYVLFAVWLRVPLPPGPLAR